MKKPIVSVIIPCYNREKTIRKCLSSITGQTLRQLEIICIDDASDDYTLRELRLAAKKDKRIKVITNQKNLGVASSRNIGLSIATGKYVSFVDSDDYIERDCYAKLHDAIVEHACDMAMCETQVEYENDSVAYDKSADEKYYSVRYIGRESLTENVIRRTNLSPTNKLFIRSIIERNGIKFPDGRLYEDAFFCVAYMCSAKDIVFLRDKLYHYVRHSGSIMTETWDTNQKNKDLAIDHLYIAIELYDYLKRRHIFEKNSRLFWNLFADFEVFAIKNSKSRNRKNEVRSISKNFLSLKHEDFVLAPIGLRFKIYKINYITDKSIRGAYRNVVRFFEGTKR